MRGSCLVLCLLCLLSIVSSQTINIYSDSLNTAVWQDYSFRGGYNFANTAPTHSGSNSISFTPSGFNGVSFFCSGCFDSTYSLGFWINGGSSGGQNVGLGIQRSDYVLQYPLTQCLGGNPIPANTWVYANCSLSGISGAGSVSRVDFLDKSGGTQGTLYFDDIALVRSSNQPTPSARPSSVTGGYNLRGLRVQGNLIVNNQGQAVKLRGVNRSGGEFMCVQNRGIFDGPTDQASIDAIRSWNVNTVRMGLAEHCWLGINGVSSAYSGVTYQNAIASYVTNLTNNGFAVILELHVGGPGSGLAGAQQPMPNSDHTANFWVGVANRFKSNDMVLFDLLNEPFPENNAVNTNSAWQCWKNGGSSCQGLYYTALGFDSLLATVRGTGATNIVLIGGINYANSLWQWLAYKPTDPTGNLVASWHVYNFNPCMTTSCWDQTVKIVAQTVPVIVGEIGENDCAGGFITPLMEYLEGLGTMHYLAWTWNGVCCGWSCSDSPALIQSYDGTPTNFGAAFKNFMVNYGAPANPNAGQSGGTVTTSISPSRPASSSTVVGATRTATMSSSSIPSQSNRASSSRIPSVSASVSATTGLTSTASISVTSRASDSRSTSITPSTSASTGLTPTATPTGSPPAAASTTMTSSDSTNSQSDSTSDSDYFTSQFTASGSQILSWLNHHPLF